MNYHIGIQFHCTNITIFTIIIMIFFLKKNDYLKSASLRILIHKIIKVSKN